MTPFVRVVVLNHRTAELTARCVAAVLAQDHPADRFEVVVVDNASGDDLADRLAPLLDRVRLVLHPRNGGFGAGCNVGIALDGHHDAVALVNSDSVPRPDWLSSLVQTWQNPPASSGRVGAVAGKVLLADSGLLNSVGCELRKGGYNADRGDGEPDDGRYDSPTEVFGWSGASVLLDRAMLDDIGVFDERFFLYYEDVEMVWRGRRRGWATVTAPAAVSVHDRGASVGRGPLFTHLDLRNRLLVLALHAPVSWLARALAVQARAAVLGPDRVLRAKVLAAVARRSVGVVAARRRLDRCATANRDTVTRFLR